MTTRKLTYAAAIREAIKQSMEQDESVYIMGLGVPDPKGIFGTTLGLHETFPDRVFDMPCAENGQTGIVMGSALTGMRPILTHQRLDFALLSLEQIINQAAKWHFMFAGQMNMPIVIRLIVGRGWGQGPQHSQSLHSLFAHIPGLKVVMPTTAYDAKGLMTASIQDNNPVIFIEHRWLHGIEDHVPETRYQLPLGHCRQLKKGTDLTLVSLSYATIDALKAADHLEQHGISCELIDVCSLRPFNIEPILDSVKQTGHLIVVDAASSLCGFGAEIISSVCENGFSLLKKAPLRLAFPEYPSPTSPSLASAYYHSPISIIQAAERLCGKDFHATTYALPSKQDIPDAAFTGPF